MRNLLIAVAAVAFVFPSFTAVADGSASDGEPVVAAPAPTFAALGTAPAERMTTGEMGRLTGSGPVTHVLVRDNRMAAFFNSGLNSNTLKKLGIPLEHIIDNPGP